MPENAEIEETEEVEEVEVCDICSNVEEDCDCQGCGICGNRVHQDRVECPHCNAAICGNCGSWHREGDYCSDCETCTSCCNCEDDSFIHSYSYKPIAQFISISKKDSYDKKIGLYFGIELEVNVSSRYDRQARAEKVQARLGDSAYLKEDGSLVSGGFEIVTHPHTFHTMKEVWSDYFNKGRISGLSSFSSGECGLHIHISRKALSRAQIRRMIVFVNSPENYNFISLIAQRGDTHYSQIKKKSPSAVAYVGDGGDDRYEAINLTNRKTIEVRIFRGSHRLDRVLKNLEFCHALTVFCNNAGYRDLTVEKFCKFVASNSKLYPNLVSYLQEFLPQSETELRDSFMAMLTTEID